MTLNTSDLAALSLALLLALLLLRWLASRKGGETRGLKILRIILSISVLIVAGIYFYMRYGAS